MTRQGNHPELTGLFRPGTSFKGSSFFRAPLQFEGYLIQLIVSTDRRADFSKNESFFSDCSPTLETDDVLYWKKARNLGTAEGAT